MSDALLLLEVSDGNRLRGVEANPAFERTTGICRSDLIGRCIEEVIPAETAQRALAPYRHCLTSGTVATDEVTLDLPSGRRSLHSTLFPVRDPSGAVRGIVGLARDTTEHLAAARKFALLHYALDSMREAAYLILESGRFEYVNREACRALGYERDELLAMTVFDVDPDLVPQQWAERWQDRQRQGALVFASRHRSKAGHAYPVEIYSSYFDYEGQGYILALARDISERQKAEALLRRREREFRTLAENSPDYIARYDQHCRPIYINPQLAAFLGYDDPRTACEQKLQEFDPSGPFADFFAMLAQTMATGSATEMELEIPGVEDETHLIRFVPEYDADKRLVGVLTIGRNISEYKRSQKRLAHQEAELAANQAAIRVMLKHSRDSEAQAQEEILVALEKMVIPYLDQAEHAVAGNAAASAAIRLARESIRHIGSPLAKKLSAPALGLSPREVQIADMIKQGRQTKEIAVRLNLSAGTVEFYRDRIRRKLQIKHKKTNLRTYLLSLT